MFATPGLVAPSLKLLAEYHPGFALGVLMGVRVYPITRTLQVQFTTTTLGQIQPASFSEFISTYSIFTNVEITLDPTSAFVGNVEKTLSDFFQSKVSGITMELAVRANGTDYNPVFDDTPLQNVPGVLAPSAGIWKMDNPDNVKAQFTLAAAPPAVPLVVTMNFSFITLGDGGARFTCMDRQLAYAELKKLGYGCPCGPGA